ncbi:MAG: ABC transporter ATP-binding protein/permease [Phycisphaerales bacterium]|nr:ABC transporter ATP-binding protein/permease [Phycisphaerales bacterium]MCI0629367.1 ABC transporter ATP-binding protein/permease [Phycisphaerales bacterium]MCI0676848.1 ABC transporter ATP-binding protein/permease [Phycisphaerales bacterium]
MTVTRASMRASLDELRRMLVRFGPWIRKERFLISVSFVTLILEIGLRLLEPWPLKFVFDHLFTVNAPGRQGSATSGASTGTVLALSAGALLVIVALRAWAGYINTVGFALAGNRILTECRSELFAHLQRLSLSFHDKSRTGDLLTRITGDIGRLKDVVVTAAMPMAAHVLTLVSMMAVMLWMNWRLALLAAITLPLFLLLTRRFGSRIRQAARRERQREGKLSATAAEAIAAIRTVQALSLQEMPNRAFAAHNRSSMWEGVQVKRLSARLERTVDLLIAVATALVLWFGARQVLAGELTPGDLVVFLAYLKNAFKPMRDVTKYSGRIARAGASGERVLEVLETTPLIRNRPDAVEAPQTIASLKFREVSFGYAPNTVALENFTLEARTGQVVALVGASGAGKSTVLGLMLRLYDPQTGRIDINDRDIREYTIQSLRARIAVVPQENMLFGVNVRDNIASGDLDVSDEQIVEAARAALAHDFILSLPEGYETVLGERGATLSEGQRKRLAIARALLRRAPILVLDEPTADLDSENIRLVMQSLSANRQSHVTFLVTHDLAIAEDADVIVHLERGRVVELGSHDELMRQSGSYARLRWIQESDGLVAPPPPPAPEVSHVGSR